MYRSKLSGEAALFLLSQPHLHLKYSEQRCGCFSARCLIRYSAHVVKLDRYTQALPEGLIDDNEQHLLIDPFLD